MKQITFLSIYMTFAFSEIPYCSELFTKVFFLCAEWDYFLAQVIIKRYFTDMTF